MPREPGGRGLRPADRCRHRASPRQPRPLVAKAEADRLDLASPMVRLHCGSFWERLLIPPFVFFFQKLYPFAAVKAPDRASAAAAGGGMLVRRRAFGEAGGIAAIRTELIDDVALAGAIKGRPGGGRIWLGLTENTTSLRRYQDLVEIWAMVARSADAQRECCGFISRPTFVHRHEIV